MATTTSPLTGRAARKLWKRGVTASATHNADGSHESQTRGVTLASATLIHRDQVRRIGGGTSDWQTEAWDHYEQVGELGFAAQWIARALSRCKLHIAEVDPNGAGDPSPTESAPDVAQQLLDSLAGGAHGEMLRRMAVHLTIAGETFLIGMPDPNLDDGADDAPTRWVVASTDEFSYQGQRARLTMPEDGRQIDLDPDDATIIRLWQPHPRHAHQADSSVRYCREILREINGLSQRIQADIDSRLAGAGVLAVPHSASMPQPHQSDSNGTQPLHDDPFIAGLTQAMITPIRDRDDASAVVPIVIKVPDDAIGKLQHISFATEFDARVVELRDSAIRRFAGSADLPGEIITGLGDTSHWNSWTISDQAVSLHVEPLLSCIAQALTSEFLRPALRATGEQNADRWCIWYDTSELTQRPDRSTEAQALYDKGELSGEALLRANGFNPETDAPTDDERLRWVALRVVTQNPEMLPALARPLGFALTPQQEQQIADTPTNRERRTSEPGGPAEPGDGNADVDSSRPEPPQQPAVTSGPA